MEELRYHKMGGNTFSIADEGGYLMFNGRFVFRDLDDLENCLDRSECEESKKRKYEILLWAKEAVGE